jgi:predicted nucleic acid-binding Zn ribbon protein
MRDWQEGRVDMACVICGQDVSRECADCCSEKCREELERRHTQKQLRAVTLYLQTDLPYYEIGRLMGVGKPRIRSLAAMLRKEKQKRRKLPSAAEMYRDKSNSVGYICGTLKIGRDRLLAEVKAAGIPLRGKGSAWNNRIAT